MSFLKTPEKKTYYKIKLVEYSLVNLKTKPNKENGFEIYSPNLILKIKPSYFIVSFHGSQISPNQLTPIIWIILRTIWSGIL